MAGRKEGVGGRGRRGGAGLWALPELRSHQACFDTLRSGEGVIIFSEGFPNVSLMDHFPPAAEDGCLETG